MFWKAIDKKDIRKRVLQALSQNVNYDQEELIGVPASYLDQRQFNTDHPLLKDAPFLLTMIHNPNHIGCHTLTENKSEEYFKGTQQLEIEVLETLATQVFKAEAKTTDGYIAPGGTEANIQAQWIYRNYFQQHKGAQLNEIALVFSEDAHYSMPKGANILGLQQLKIPVNNDNRKMDLEAFKSILIQAQTDGIKYLIVNLNMATTMFGSVDCIDPIVELIEQFNFEFKIHIDAAFGGFIYPFTNPNNELSFAHPLVNSITVDGHKMLQAPYGTGIFLIRKGWMNYTTSQDAKYVLGLDSTICGSRSGANAVAMWMIMMGYGSEGWTKNCQELVSRTDTICNGLKQLEIDFFREPHMNIITIKANQLPVSIAKKFNLVANDHDNPEWFKIVVMPHVTKDIIQRFLNNLRLNVWVNA